MGLEGIKLTRSTLILIKLLSFKDIREHSRYSFENFSSKMGKTHYSSDNFSSFLLLLLRFVLKIPLSRL